MKNHSPKYVTWQAIHSLAQKLNLPVPGPYEQDWEYIVSDSSRIGEFLSFYETETLTIDEKFTLMIVIISSCDDVLAVGECLQVEIMNRIRHIINSDRNIHKHTLLYWALEDEEELENCFAITPFIRELIANIK